MNILGRPLNWNRVKKAYILFNMRQGRGSGYIDRFRDLFVLSGAFKIMFPALPIIAIMPIGVIWLTITYAFGYYDEKKIKLWQMESEMNSTWISPFNKRVDKNLKHLVKKVK